MKSVSIVGPGRVGGGLAVSLAAKGYTIDALFARDSGDHGELANRFNFKQISAVNKITSDVIFITTRDSEIENVAKDIADRVSGQGSVFHTSGSYSSDVLSTVAQVGRSVGSIHPLVSISRSIDAQERFRGAYFCIEGDVSAVALATDIVHDLGGTPFAIPSNKKTLYHAGAVMACGHLVALLDASIETLESCGLDRQTARKVLMPLVRSTIENFHEQDAARALTGTFARADLDTFSRHVSALNDAVDEDLIEIYLLLGERSLELAEKVGVSADSLERMRARVAIARTKLRD